MEPKYSRFVAYATLVAHDHLRQSLGDDSHVPNVQVLREAARIGSREATSRVFPGLPRHPFTVNPLEDIVLGLRYHYVMDPDGLEGGSLSAPSSSQNLGGNPPTAEERRAALNSGRKEFPFAPRSASRLRVRKLED